MNIGEVCVRVSNRRVLMGMRVRLLTIPLKVVRVLMMLIVPVPMVMFKHLVSVWMFMPLSDMQPDSKVSGQ
ncbi:hypothetical protein AWB71_05088 [Caballeronia peredens]|nr:hypothetical protein AWB71_05088 [Caballeronia peredens]